MIKQTTPWYFPILCCPDCGGELKHNVTNLICMACNYERVVASPLDMRPKKPRPLSLNYERHVSAYIDADIGGTLVARPPIMFDGPIGVRNASELFSAMMPFLKPGDRVLDLGCGPRDQAASAAYLKYQYAGVDAYDKAADILADIHALPFSDNSIDGAISFAVLEHLYNPHIALHEIWRVLKPGGILCGTVSQGEPFHSSYFHMTPWGVISLFGSFDLKLHRLWPSHDTLFAIAGMGRYPRIIKSLLRLVGTIHEVFPFLAPRKIKWPIRNKMLDTLYRAASICFLVQKQP